LTLESRLTADGQAREKVRLAREADLSDPDQKLDG
jgi:hypothetical protein